MSATSPVRTVTKSFTLEIQPGWQIHVSGSKQSYTFLRHVVNGDEEWLECAGPTGANRAFDVSRLVSVEVGASDGD